MLGLPQFSFDEIESYIVNRSATLPVLAKIQISPHIGLASASLIESTVKRTAMQLAYLRLCEEYIEKEVNAVLAALKKKPGDILLQDKRSALNLQKELILSLNENITVEILEYIYFQIILPLRESGKLEPSSIAMRAALVSSIVTENPIYEILHKETLKWNPVLKQKVKGEDFSHFIELICAFLKEQKLQAVLLQLEKHENYLEDFLRDKTESFNPSIAHAAMLSFSKGNSIKVNPIINSGAVKKKRKASKRNVVESSKSSKIRKL